MITEMTNRCSHFVAGRHLLVIQDTTSFNLSAHHRRLKKDAGLGTIEDNYTLGFFLHASLVVDRLTDTVLGYSDVQLWHRTYEDPLRQSRIRALPIEQKESFKWIRACQHSQETLREAASITFVEDRDGDIYEQFALIPDSKTDLIIRSRADRRLAGGGKLFAALHAQPVAAQYTLEVAAEPRSKKHKRTATLEVRFTKVAIAAPRDYFKKDLPEQVELYAVEAREAGYSGGDKICWRLLTTHQISSVQQAIEVIGLYTKRWHIEQLFRLLKKQGFGLEGSELESGWAIRKLSVLALGAALCVVQLMYASEAGSDQPLNEVFTPLQQACLGQAAKQLQGATEKLSNPYLVKTTPWARWIIARLGGWSGYSSQRPPGPITLKRGLDKFTQIFNGWCLALKYCEDVYTQ